MYCNNSNCKEKDHCWRYQNNPSDGYHWCVKNFGECDKCSSFLENK